MNRRKLAALTTSVVIGAALSLTACGSGGSGGDQLKQGDTQQVGVADINAKDPATLKDGGEFKYPVDSLADNWNYNEVDGTVSDGFNMISTVEPELFVQNADSTVSTNPAYLVSAKITSTDPQVITYDLNPKAKWSDGTQLSWEDFKAQATALSGKNAAYQIASSTGYENIAKVERGATDQEAKVTFSKHFAEWKSLFSPLYPKSLNSSATEFNKGWADKPKLTAGPFKIGNIDLTAKTVTVVRDPNWWGDKPRVDKITFKVLARSALADALANGTIDFYQIGSDVDLFHRAQQTQGVQVRQSLTPDYNQLTFNGAPSAIMSDPKLRVAVMQGIDTSTIARALLGPIQPQPKTLGNHIFLIGAKPYQDNSAPAKYNPDAAKKALDALGWKQSGQFRSKNGKPLDLRLVIPSDNPPSEQISKLAQSQLATIGVKIDIVTVPVADFFQKYVNVGNFDIASFRWLSNSFPISSSKSIYYLDPHNVNQNYGHVGNDTINKLFDQANAELDDTKRAALANQLDKEIWAAGHQLPLFQNPGAVAVRGTVANFGAPGYANSPYDWVKVGFTQ